MAANSLYAYIPEDRGAEEMLGPDVFKVDYVDPDVGETLHVTYAPIWRLYPDTGKVSEEDRTEYPIDQPSYLVDVKDQVTGNVIQLDVVSTKQFDRLAKRIQYNIYGPDAPYGMSRDFDDIQEETLNEETYETPIEELKSTDRSPSTRTSKDGNTFTTAVSETTDIGIAKIHIPTDLNATAVLSVQASAREVNDDDEAKPIGVPPGEVLVFRNKGGTLFCPTIEIPEGIIMDRSAIDVTIRPCVYSVNVNFPEAIDVRKTIKDPKPKAPLFSLVNILGGDDRDDGVFNDYTRHVRRDGTVPITKKVSSRPIPL